MSKALYTISAIVLINIYLISCVNEAAPVIVKDSLQIVIPDTFSIPKGAYGDMVHYGQNLFLQTAYYIGPNGINGHFTGNKISCTNCHQNAGTKPFSLNLMQSFLRYPQYRAREGKVLSLAERVNNCVMRPGNGKPLPLDSKEMIAFLSYLKWINDQTGKQTKILGDENLPIEFSERAADPTIGKHLFTLHCERCHGKDGNGQWNVDSSAYTYPPLWGNNAYQPGSSMHRVVKMARWLKANMPNDKATYDKPFLTDEEALDIAAFVNDDRIHKRPDPVTFDYPVAIEKAIDYGRGPFADTFSAQQHKFGPFKPILNYWKEKGMKARW